MARMSNVAAFFLVWSCGFCYAVQVFVKGAHGMVSWKDAPTWRDRSVVPTPPPKDVAAYKKRGEIPYPYPGVHVVKHVYVGPGASIAQGQKANKKKNLIQKMFFSLPVGAELPIYYTHKQVSHKKSTVADSEENEELSPDLETRTIAKQNLLPSTEGALRYHGIGGKYLRPRTIIDRYRVLKNRGQVFKRPSRTQRILNVLRRSEPPGLKMTRRDVSKTKKPSLLKQNNDMNAKFSKLENVGFVTKGKNIKKSGLPKGETLDDVLTKLKPGKKM